MCVSAFALPSGRWWVPSCNDTNHDHEYHEYHGFELCYEEQYEQPMFVSYCLTKEQMNFVGLSRSDQFAADPNISTGSASLSDYKGSGFSRGHLAPNSDMNYSATTQTECFLLSNMSPQEQNYFNGGIWLQAENAVRELGKVHDFCIVVTGPILDKSKFSVIGNNKVAVPDDFYKIAVFIDGDQIVGSFAVIMSQTNKLASKASLLSWKDPRFIASISEIEARTGIDFFPVLDDSIEQYLENYKYGSSFKAQTIKLDGTKVSNSKVYVTKGTQVFPENNDTTVTNAVSPKSTMTIIADSDLLKTNLRNKKYISNIAKSYKVTLDDTLYSIGYYGLTPYLGNKYTISKDVYLIYTDLGEADLIKEAVINNEITLEDLCGLFNTDQNNLMVYLGVLKIDLSAVYRLYRK